MVEEKAAAEARAHEAHKMIDHHANKAEEAIAQAEEDLKKKLATAERRYQEADEARRRAVASANSQLDEMEQVMSWVRAPKANPAPLFPI